MGQLCSRPRAKEDGHQVDSFGQTSIHSDLDYKSAHSSLNGSERPQHVVAHQPVRQQSLEGSELDLVVQQLHQNDQAANTSAELLRQWDHDHNVLLRSIDATIEVQRTHSQHRAGSDVGVPQGVPTPYLHAQHPQLQSKLDGPARSPPPPEGHHQQAAGPPLHAEPLLLQANQAYRDGRLLQAHSKLQQLSKLRHVDFLHSHVPTAGLGFDPQHLESIKQRIDESLQALRNTSGWQISRDDDLKVAYQHIAGSSVHSFKFAADFDTPLEHLLSLSREFDLTSTWNSYVLDSMILQEPSIFESTVYSGSWLPFPFPSIDCVVQARGVDLADEDQSLLIIMHSPEDMSQLDHLLPAAAAKRKRALIMPGTCIRLQPLKPRADGQQRVRAQVIVHMQPPVKHVPSVLLNFVLKVMSPFIYNTMNKVLKTEFSSPDKVLPTRIRQKPELYGLIGPRVHEFTDRLAAE